MDSKADVKSILARFQGGGANVEENPPTTSGQSKPMQHLAASSGPALPRKKPILENLSGSGINIHPKPAFQTNATPSKSFSEVQEALSSRFAKIQDNTNSNHKPFIAEHVGKPPPWQPPAPTNQAPKTPFHKPSLTSDLPESKPVFAKPSPGFTPKPSWVKQEDVNAPSNPCATPPKVPPLQRKPSSSIAKFIHQNEESVRANADTTNKAFPAGGPAFNKPPSSFRTAHNAFNKERDENTEQGDSSVKGVGDGKQVMSASKPTPPPMPPASKKPSFVRRAQNTSSPATSDDTSTPKRNPLPSLLELGSAPAKPNRPPQVNLERFREGTRHSQNGIATVTTAIIPPPLLPNPSNSSSYVTAAQPPPPPVPSLPPGHPAAIIQADPDENYDDVGVMTSSPPPLPPSTAHPSLLAMRDDGSDGEMYEDLDDRWEMADSKEQERKIENEKEEKKRLEAERKEQKEREKKENDMRKRFKLIGPVVVIHQGKACVDTKGSKTDLGMKQGDAVDIIRVQGNPEGKWLARAQDGLVGYVKTTSVEIDFDSLKHQNSSHQSQQEHEPEVYDDIETVPQDNFKSGLRSQGVALPPPPDDGEIYDDIVDPSLDMSPRDTRPARIPPAPKPAGFLWMFERKRASLRANEVPPPHQFNAEANSDMQTAIDEEIYDDVDAQSFPPPICSLPPLKAKSRIEEMDPKRQKKLEKEEKDFRKKFKYEGEIQVLYQVTITASLTNKKWSGKDLPIKAGEKLNVIVGAVDNKLICQNEDGKFGYVSTKHIVVDDAEIYDDVGEDGIYDND